jgi:hypothetical protein
MFRQPLNIYFLFFNIIQICTFSIASMPGIEEHGVLIF